MNHEHSEASPKWRTRANWVLAGFLVIAGYFLITEHRAHLLGFTPYLPILLLAACPLMHVFMHHGHGGHGDHGNEERKNTPPGISGENRDRRQDATPPHQH
ncbi:MAG: DUF2933 domain-containing protein [Betaproteobacteria bacterium]